MPIKVFLNEHSLSRSLFPKGEFLRTHCVGPIGLNGFLHLGLLFGFFHPYEPWPLFSGWVVVGGGGGGGGYYLQNFLGVKK